jgi:hypothetical protein
MKLGCCARPEAGASARPSSRARELETLGCIDPSEHDSRGGSRGRADQIVCARLARRAPHQIPRRTGRESAASHRVRYLDRLFESDRLGAQGSRRDPVEPTAVRDQRRQRDRGHRATTTHSRKKRACRAARPASRASSLASNTRVPSFETLVPELLRLAHAERTLAWIVSFLIRGLKRLPLQRAAWSDRSAGWPSSATCSRTRCRHVRSPRDAFER